MNICSKGMTKLPVSYRTFGTCQAEFETLNVGALSAISSQLSALPTEGTWAIMRGVPSRLRCVEVAKWVWLNLIDPHKGDMAKSVVPCTAE